MALVGGDWNQMAQQVDNGVGLYKDASIAFLSMEVLFGVFTSPVLVEPCLRWSIWKHNSLAAQHSFRGNNGYNSFKGNLSKYYSQSGKMKTSTVAGLRPSASKVTEYVPPTTLQRSILYVALFWGDEKLSTISRKGMRRVTALTEAGISQLTNSVLDSV